MLLEALQTYMMGVTAVTDLIGDRLDTDMIDQNETRDCADMRIVVSNHEKYLAGLVGIATSTVTFDCYSLHRSNAHAIAIAMMFSGITSQKGVVGSTDIRSVELRSGPDDSDDGVLPASNQLRYVTSFTLVIQWVTAGD